MNTTNTTDDDTTTEAARLAATDAAMNPDTMHQLVGTPCTVSIGSDRYAYTVVAVTAHTITVGKPMVDGSWSQSTTFRKSKRPADLAKGKPVWRSGSYRLSLGVADEYRDPSF